MKISNAKIVSTDLTNNTVKISFTISEATENVNIYLKINDEEYKEIFSNKTNETLEHTANISRGVNNLLLKATDSTTEYISEPIQVLLKEEPSIKNLECSYSDSTGKYILKFAFNGDANFKYNIYLKLDSNDYIEVLSNQISGDKTIEQTSTMGEHTCILKVSDGYNDYTFSPFQFEITNHKPILSKVLVTDITNSGEAYIYYSTKDIESSTLTHKLVIGATETVITPTQVDNFYSYKVTGLSEGISNCTINISDGIDIVSSDIFSIEVFSDTIDKKELLRRAKVRYDSAYQQLRDIIVSVISDLKYDYDVENALIAKAQDNYKIEYSNFNKISQQSIDTIGTNKVNVTRQDLETQINDVDNAVDTLETTMNGVFKDGILDESEKKILKENLNLVAKEKADVDRDYETLYNNEDLLDPTKTKLQTKYNDFTTAHTTLVTTINGIVNKAGIIDNTDKANMDTAFENWRVALGDYRNASLEAIDAIAKKKADDSADVVDKKWAEIILDPETGIQMQVGNLTNKVNNVTTKVDDSVKDVQVMYYLSTSETVLEGGEWSDVAPQWEKDKYMWSKTVVTLTNGTVNESDPTCIAGAKGESTYTWIKYADDENGTNMSNDPTDKSYIGFAYNKTTPTESDNASEYTWSLIKGRDGIDGKDGTSVTILGSYDTLEELNSAHPNGNNNGDSYIIAGDLYVWQGTEFINVGQIKGEDGIDGKTPYMHIKYSNDGGLTFTPSNGEEAGDYIGLYTDFIEVDSTDVTKYTWTKIKGYDGVNAVTYYTWIKYSDNADGTGLYDVPNENTKYIGIAVNQTIQTESTDKTKYVWSKFRGEDGVDGIDGVPGTNGIDGITYYTWIKYADDSNGNGMSDNPTNKDYIGFAYNKTTATESTNPTDYKWSLIKGTDGVDGTNGVDGITYYTWIKYSDNADGTGLYDIPNSNTKYIGIATNKPTATESTNKTDYVWSLFKGEDGISGTDGIGVNNIVEEYYLSTSKETQEGGEWVETPPTWEVGKYMWTRSRIEYSNGTVEYTTPICDSSWEAANNVTTELQEIDKRIAKIEVDSDSITSTVSHITNKVDNMTIGTRNYVLNSAFNNDTKGWTFHDNCYIDKTKTLNNYPSCKSEQSGLTADSWRGCRNFSLPTRNNLGIKEGETWTFSCWYYVENKTTFDSGLVLEIKGKPSGSTNDNTLANVPVSKDNIIEGKWTRLVKTFTVNKNYDECYIYAYVIRNGTAWFTCFQLEKSTVVSDWNTAPEDDSDRLTTAESTITQLSNSITSMVTEDDVHSIIQQTPSDIQIGFNGISNNVVINSSGLTVNQGYIACDTLTTPAGHQPVINLFQKTVNGKTINCQIDARTSDGGDYGGAIRLKYDSNSYLMVNDSGVFFFIEGEQAFSFVSDGSTYGAISINASNIGYLEMGASWIAYNNKGLAFDDHIHEIYSLTTHNHDDKYASSSHTHNYASSSHTHKSIQSTYSSSYNVNTYGGSTGGEVSLNAGGATVYLSNYTAFSLYPESSNIDLGLSNNRWRYIYSQNALNTSDKKYKENIIYIDELLNNEIMTLSLDNNTQQETLFLDFIKNDFRPALYNYTSESGEEQLADEQIGFIANDIIDTEVGKTFLYDYGTNGESEIMFSPIGYTTVIGRALQEEIMVRENKIAELENRIVELENKLNQ